MSVCGWLLLFGAGTHPLLKYDQHTCCTTAWREGCQRGGQCGPLGSVLADPSCRWWWLSHKGRPSAIVQLLDVAGTSPPEQQHSLSAASTGLCFLPAALLKVPFYTETAVGAVYEAARRYLLAGVLSCACLLPYAFACVLEPLQGCELVQPLPEPLGQYPLPRGSSAESLWACSQLSPIQECVCMCVYICQSTRGRLMSDS